jgi:hypothetical protein
MTARGGTSGPVVVGAGRAASCLDAGRAVPLFWAGRAAPRGRPRLRGPCSSSLGAGCAAVEGPRRASGPAAG